MIPSSNIGMDQQSQYVGPSQMISQPQPIPQQSVQAVQPDLDTLIHQKTRIIVDPKERLDIKLKAMESLRDLFDDVIVKDKISLTAQVSAQIFHHIITNTNPVYNDITIAFRLRKLAIEFYYRFSSNEGYKIHNKQLEDLIYSVMLEENEVMGLLMMKYLTELLKSQKIINPTGILQLLNNLRTSIDNMCYNFEANPTSFFFKYSFNSENIRDDSYMANIVENTHFDTQVRYQKGGPVNCLLPKLKNAVKVVNEFMSMENVFFHFYKEKVLEDIKNTIMILQRFCKLDVKNVNGNIESDFLTIFQEAQYKCFLYFFSILRPKDIRDPINMETIPIVKSYAPDIAIGLKTLLKNMGNASAAFRKDFLSLVKNMFSTDIRTELFDILVDICYDEKLIGPPSLVTSQFRSDLYMIKADLLHSARQHIDWSTFQLLMTFVVRDCMDFTLTPTIQGIYGKLILNFIDACQKAKDSKFPQLSVGFTHDSAKTAYENIFQLICRKLHVVTQRGIKVLLRKAYTFPVQEAEKIFNEGDEDDEDDDVVTDKSKSVDPNADPEDLIELSEESTALDDFEEESDDDGNENAWDIIFGKFMNETLEEITDELIERAEKGINVDKKSERQKEGRLLIEQELKKMEKNPGSLSEAFISKLKDKGDLLSLSAFKSEDPRFTMFWLDRPLTKEIPYVPHDFDSSAKPDSTFTPPETLPFDLINTKLIVKNYSIALKALMYALQQYQVFQSIDISVTHLSLLNRLFYDYLLIIELSSLGYYPDEDPTAKPQYYNSISVDDKEVIDCFLQIFASLHPAVFESILRNHISYIQRRSLLSLSVFNLLCSMMANQYLFMSVCSVYLDYLMDNVDIMFLLDDEDNIRNSNGWAKIFKFLLTYLTNAVAMEPHTRNFIPRVQSFIYEFVSKGIRSILRLSDQIVTSLTAHGNSAPFHLIKLLFRQCGSGQADALYKAFVPLFPSFLQWLSSSQNLLSTETCHDLFIEMCLSLPARLSSLIPFMPLLIDATINSAQNFSLFNAQGLRTIELCLDNYTIPQLKEFFGNLFPRLHEQLWNVSWAVDTQIASIAIRLMGKLSAMNRSSLCDIQRLTMNERPYDSSVNFVVKFERSGKSPDAIIRESIQYSQLEESRDAIDISRFIEKKVNFEEPFVDPEPLKASFSLHTIIAQCLAVVRNMITTETNIQKSYFCQGRAESACLCLSFLKSAFDSYSQSFVSKEEFVAAMVIINDKIIKKSNEQHNKFSIKLPIETRRDSNGSIRKAYVDALTTLIFAASNTDLREDFSKDFEVIVDNLTLQLHIETGFSCFETLADRRFIGHGIDAGILIDSICKVLCDPYIRLHGAGCITILRMMQTMLSFSSDPKMALNIPLIYYMIDKLAELCTRHMFVERLGGISGIKVLVENLPDNCIMANFDALFGACGAVLQHGDDDISLMSQETAIEVAKMLLDKILSKDLSEEIKDEAMEFVVNYVFEHCKSSSIWMAELISEILFVLGVQDNPKVFDLIRIRYCNFLEWHQKEFVVSSMEYRIAQLKIFNAFMSCMEKFNIFTQYTSKYLPVLCSTYIYSDEELVTSPNYEKIPLVHAQGATIVPWSVVMKRDNGMMFYGRLKEFRKIVARTLTNFCNCLMDYYEDLRKNINLKCNINENDLNLNGPENPEDAISLIIGTHLIAAKSIMDERNEHSITDLAMLFDKYSFATFKVDLITYLVSELRTYDMRHLKLIDAIIDEDEELPKDAVERMLYGDSDYEPIYSHIPQAFEKSDPYIEYFKAYLSIVHKLRYAKDRKILDGLFNLITNPEMLHYHEIDKYDVFGPLSIFIQYQEAPFTCRYFLICFLNHEAISNPIKREAFMRLITHKEAYSFRSMINEYERELLFILRTHRMPIKDGTTRKFKIVDHGLIDEFVLKVLFHYLNQHPNYFIRSELGNQLKKFYLSNYFRGNYAFFDHGFDNQNRVKVTVFNEWKASVPDMVQSLLIKYFLKNINRFDILLTLCTSLHQNYFTDNSALRRLISEFVVKRTTLIWKRNLLQFAIDKTAKVLDLKVSPDDVMGLSRIKDAQVYLGNFFLYVVHPCFVYSLQQFPSQMVFVGNRDHYMVKKYWKKEDLKRQNAPNYVKVFCEEVLERMGKSQDKVRPELAHGLIQFSILLMQRAATHIHSPGSKQQSKHLQICMLIAWPSLNGTGIYADKGLRTVAQFFLATVMTAVYIKKDIVYQHFDSLMGTTDNRDNPLIQKALDTVAYHVAFGRKDDCMGGFTEKIKDHMNADGLNFIKAANVLHMLARNYKSFFAYRAGLVPSIIYILTKVNMMRSTLALQISIDGLETIIGWEEMLLEKIEELDKLLESEEYTPEDRAAKRARFIQSPEFISLPPSLVDNVALALCKATMQSLQEKDERSKKVFVLFQKALNPNLFCRPICVRLERMLQTPKKEMQADTPQYSAILNQATHLCKILTQIFSNVPAESVFQCAIYLQNAFKNCLLMGHRPLFESALLLIVKVVEISKDFLVNERRFYTIFSTLDDCFTMLGENFVKKQDLNEITFMVSAMRNICLANDFAYRNLCGPTFIRLLSHVVKCSKLQSQQPGQEQSLIDKRGHDILANGIDMFHQKIKITPPDVFRLFLQHVTYPLLTWHETVSPKLLEIICKTMEEAVKIGFDRTHVSVISALTRHHMNAIMKNLVTVISFFNAMAVICEEKSIFDREYVELWLPFYLALSNQNDYGIRLQFLNLFDSKLPKTAFERLSWLLAFESWQLTNSSSIVPIFVEMMLRCCKGLGYTHSPKMAIKPDFFEEIPRVVEPETVKTEEQVKISPECSFTFPMHDFVMNIKAKYLNDYEHFQELIPEPSPARKFNNCGINCKPLKLTTICSNYHTLLTDSEGQVQRDFPEFVIGISSILLYESDMAGKMFVDLFTSMWKSFTEYERNIITELMAHFLQMPVFASLPPQSVKPFWQAMMECDPPMRIDKLKIISSPCGPRYAHYSISLAEDAYYKSVNLNGAIDDLKLLYKSVNEYDMYTYMWKLRELTTKAWKAHWLYYQSRYKETLQLTSECQKEYIKDFEIMSDKSEDGALVKVMDEVTINKKIDYDCLTEFGLMSLKQMNKWSTVLTYAEKEKNVPLHLECLYHMAKTSDDWNEIDNLLHLAGNLDDLGVSFQNMIYRVCLLISRNDSGKLQEDNYQEKLRTILLEKMRRLPAYFVPKYLELFRDCSFLVELIDSMKILLELSKTDLVTVIDSVIKSIVVSWRYRTVCRTDTPVEGLAPLKARFVLLLMINNFINTRRPELRELGHPQYTLTPMHNVAENVVHMARHLSHFEMYDEAKKEITELKYSEYLNQYDCCVAMCDLIKYTLKQARKQMGSISKEQFASEIDAFLRANVDYFKPDIMALYSTRRGEIFEYLKSMKNAEDCFRIALKLESGFDKNAYNPVTLPVLKSITRFMYNRNCGDWRDGQEIYGICAILELLVKLKPVESIKHVSKLIWAIKRMNITQINIDRLNNAIIKYAPKIPPVSFLSFIQTIVSEISTTKSKACGIILTVLLQVFPIHAAYYILLEIGSELFHQTVDEMKGKYKIDDDLERICTDLPEDPNTFSSPFCTFRPDTIDSNKVENLTRKSYAFVEMVNTNTDEYKNGVEMLKDILKRICRNVPSDISAFDDLIYGFEEMKPTQAVVLLKKMYKLWSGLLNNDEGYIDYVTEAKEFVSENTMNSEVLQKIAEEILEMIDDTLKEIGAINEKLERVGVVIKKLENYINKYERVMLLSDVSPILARFTGQRAHLPSLSSFFEPVFVRCMPFIDLFLPIIKTVATNGKIYQLIDVKLSTGKVVTYYIDETDAEDYFKSPFKALAHLNTIIDKFHDTNKRGAVFRIPIIFQLEKMRLTEVGEINLNRFSSYENVIKPFTSLIYEFKGDVECKHIVDQIVKYHELTSSGMSEREVMEEMEKIVDLNRLKQYMNERYDDPSSNWYVRKQVATQLALHSVLEYGFELNPINYEDLIFDHLYARIWNMRPTIENVNVDNSMDVDAVKKNIIPFRMTPMLENYMGFSLEGHFAATFTAVATCMYKKKFSTFLKPFYFDIYQRLKCRSEGRRMTLGDIAYIEKDMEHFESKFKYVADNLDTAVFELIEQAKNMSNRVEGMHLAQLPWL